VALADELRNICFVQGISSDRIQTTVRSRNGSTFDEIAEMALEEESAIFSKNERYRQGANPGRLVCHNCGKTGHVAAKCYLKKKKNVRVNKLGAEPRESVGKPRGPRKSDIKCYNCGETGHMARECRKPRSSRGSTQLSGTGTEGRSPDRSKPSIGAVHVIGSGNKAATECIRLQMDISKGHELSLLVDTGADISLIKPDNLDKTREFDPDSRVTVKSVDGSTIETFGTIQTVVNVDSFKILFTFQLVSKQVDIPCNGILGRDFLEHAGAQIYYGSGTLTLRTGSRKISKALSPINAESKTKGIRRLVLPSRMELMVKLPVKKGTIISEGITEKQEIQEGVYLVGAMTKIQAGYAITSIANTNSEETEIDEPVLDVEEIEPGTEEHPQKGMLVAGH